MALTILYEDSQLGREFPLHQLIMQMVIDDASISHWELGRQIYKTPKRGVDKLLHELPNTSLIAGDGLMCVLVDRDKIVEHVNKNLRGAPRSLTMSSIPTRRDRHKAL